MVINCLNELSLPYCPHMIKDVNVDEVERH